MNKVFLIGNLTRDPELSETPSGVSVCKFSIAVNRRTNGDPKTDFYNITAWRGLGETVAKYAKKGNKIAVCGNIELREYEDREGHKRTAIDIIAQDVEFLTPKGEQAAEPEAAKPSNRLIPQPVDDDGDIPF